MQLSFHHDYKGSVDQVVALFRNPEFITDVAQHAGAQNHDVSVTDGVTNLRMALATPSNVARFVGSTADITMVFRWSEAEASGVRRGTVDVAVKGLPVSVDAAVVLTPTETGCTGTYSGDLTVKLPLVGGKVEKLVAPFIGEAFAGIERRAAEWLAR